jgi:hypothetical protein
MVQLHAAEFGQTPARLSLDADALADARQRPNPVEGVARILVSEGFRLEDPSYMGLGHTFVKDDVSIDVLAPDGLGARSEGALVTIPPAYTLEVPGGSQALHRTEWVELEIAARRGRIPRPNLLGAILLKARAVDVDDAPESQRQDLALLLSLVEDPAPLVSLLRGGERSWIARRVEMNDPQAPCWQGLSRDAAQIALSTLRALGGFERA